MLDAVQYLDPQTATRESDQSGADTETSTCAGRRANAGRIDVEDRECRRRHERNHADLRRLHCLAGQNVRGNRDRQTLEQVLDESHDEIAHIDSSRGRGLRFRLHFVLRVRRKSYRPPPACTVRDPE